MSCHLNMVMEMLRSASVTLEQLLPHLPQSLAYLAALAHIPELAEDAPQHMSVQPRAPLMTTLCSHCA